MKCISSLHNIIIDFEGYCCLHSRWSQHDSLSLPPTRATRKQRTNKLGRCYQPERPFCTLTRYTLRRRTAAFTYMCLSAQACGRETRVHASRWHAGPCLRRMSAAAHLLGLWVWIPSGAWMFVCCECCVLSGRGLCDELITRPEEYYRLLYVVVWSRNLVNEEALAHWELSHQKQTNRGAMYS